MSRYERWEVRFNGEVWPHEGAPGHRTLAAALLAAERRSDYLEGLGYTYWPELSYEYQAGRQDSPESRIQYSVYTNEAQEYATVSIYRS